MGDTVVTMLSISAFLTLILAILTSCSAICINSNTSSIYRLFTGLLASTGLGFAVTVFWFCHVVISGDHPIDETAFGFGIGAYFDIISMAVLGFSLFLAVGVHIYKEFKKSDGNELVTTKEDGNKLKADGNKLKAKYKLDGDKVVPVTKDSKAGCLSKIFKGDWLWSDEGMEMSKKDILKVAETHGKLAEVKAYLEKNYPNGKNVPQNVYLEIRKKFRLYVAREMDVDW
jgi:hypothetical protein